MCVSCVSRYLRDSGLKAGKIPVIKGIRKGHLNYANALTERAISPDR